MKRPGESSPQSPNGRAVDAFAGNAGARFLPVRGYAQLHAEHFPKLLELSRLEHHVYDVLALKCGGWKDESKSPFVRAEDLAELLGATRVRVLLAITKLIRLDLVRRLTPAQANRGCQYKIVQPGELAVIQKDHCAPSPHGTSWINAGGAAVIHADHCEAGTPYSVPDRSEQTQTSSLQSISPPSLPDRRRGGGEAMPIPRSWVDVARRLFPQCHSPEKFLASLARHGFTDEEGASYLERAHKAPDLPQQDHRALAAWCSAERCGEWLERRRRAPKPVASTSPAVQVPVYQSPVDLVRAARAAEAIAAMGKDASGDARTAHGSRESAIVRLKRSWPEQTGISEQASSALAGGKR